MFRRFLLLLLVCEFFIQHLSSSPTTPLCSRFQYSRRVYVSSHDLHGFNSTIASCASQVLLHCNHYCIVNSICSYIIDCSKLHFFALQLLLHCHFSTSQMFYHCNCSYIVNSFVAWKLFFLQIVLFLIIVFLFFCRF